jgi:fimbrial chaperone protein
MRFLTVFCCLALMCLSGAGRANAIEISPTILQFQQDQSHQSVRIANRGKSAIIVQARSFIWEQTGDADTLLASSRIVISPPIFTLKAGATQTLRVMLRDSEPLGRARHFRLLIDDITPAPAGQLGSRMVIRMSLPVFAQASSPQPGHLDWSIDNSRSDAVTLMATNDGGSYENVRSVERVNSDGSVSAASPLASNTYILPGVTRQWTIPKAHQQTHGPITLNVTTVAGVVSKVTLKD